MFKKIYNLFKILRKLSISGAVETLDQLKPLPLSLKILFKVFSIGSNKNEKVLIPGDKEISTYKDRLANGLPVAPIVWQNIKQTAKDLNIQNLDRFNSAINKT